MGLCVDIEQTNKETGGCKAALRKPLTSKLESGSKGSSCLDENKQELQWAKRFLPPDVRTILCRRCSNADVPGLFSVGPLLLP